MRLTADAALTTNCRLVAQLERGHDVTLRPGTRTAAAVAQAIETHARLQGTAIDAVLRAEAIAQMWRPSEHEQEP